MNIFESFTNRYPVNKTLRFELRPIGRTSETIKENQILKSDKQRLADSEIVKSLLDDFYKKHLERSLSGLTLSGLEEYHRFFTSEPAEQDIKSFAKLQEQLRIAVSNCLTADPLYDHFFNAKMFKELLPNTLDSEALKSTVASFDKFTSYFKAFFEVRKHLFSVEEKHGTVAHRIINENLPIFMNNLRIFKELMSVPEIRGKVEQMNVVFEDTLPSGMIQDLFTVESYNRCLTNKDIVVYNSIINGYVKKDETIHGINTYVGLYNKANSEQRLPKLKPLYKQILSDRETLSYIPEAFENDQQLLNAVKVTIERIYEECLSTVNNSSLVTLIGNLPAYDLEHIYISGKALHGLSHSLYGDKNYIADVIKQYTKKKTDASAQSISISEMNRVLSACTESEVHLEDYFALFCKNQQNLLFAFDRAYEQSQKLFDMTYESRNRGLAADTENIAVIKNLMDSVKAIETFLKPLVRTNHECISDDSFYSEFDSAYSTLNRITPLYNQVRSYLTKKPYTTDKIKLNFNSANLLSGWDKAGLKSTLSVLMRKDGNYYLGIMNKAYAKDVVHIFECPYQTAGECYEKMDYKLLPGPFKMLPKVVFASSNREIYHPSDEIMEIYKSGSYKHGDSFCLADCHKMIDFYKSCIKENSDWDCFDFKFSDTDTYENIGQFFREVQEQGYYIAFHNIPVSKIDELVENGYLFLFRLHNKDFSKNAKGNPDLYTIYWKMLFDERNLENVAYKLNGNSEVFFRTASIDEDNRIIHPKNEPIAKKHIEAEKKHETSMFPYDLIKDRRYTEDKYLFHVPLTMNYVPRGNAFLNEDVQELIQKQKPNVMGIYRGENNFLYVTILDNKGEILYQNSLNIIPNSKGYDVDYHALLNKREHDMKVEQKEWVYQKSIKNMKNGYISQAVHLITDLMIKYQALIIMEDLSVTFMEERKTIEAAVYKNFESALVSKLNFLVDKTLNPDSMGGALHAYQLTNDVTNFKSLGKQNGFIFYVSPWAVNRTDPATGYACLFRAKYVNEKQAKEFIRKFNSIRYNSSAGYFEIIYNDSVVSERGNNKSWTICSHGERTVCKKHPDGTREYISVDITKRIMEHLSAQGIDYTSDNLIDEICSVKRNGFLREIIADINLIVQMSNYDNDTSYFISPVCNTEGRFFDTRYHKASNGFNIPKEIDAVKSFNIAKKGLLLVERICSKADKKIQLTISSQDWTTYSNNNPMQYKLL